MAYLALYRKYRPARFAEVYGQPNVVKALQNQIVNDRIAHAYLFCGPRGTGKTSVAKLFAKAINCREPVEGEPCGRCPACLDAEGTSMDVIEIDAASNNQVDKVREMIENVHYLPAVGKKRVYIVDEVHMLSAAAFNALLKTLEEPPAHVVFILATTEPQKLLPTVLSRCQRFDFRRVADNDVYACLERVAKAEGIDIGREALKAITAFSEGGLRDALSLLDQCVSLSDSGVVTPELIYSTLGTSDGVFFEKMCGYLLHSDANSALTALDGFISQGGDLRIFAQDLCRCLRDIYAGETRLPGAELMPANVLRCLQIMAETESKLRYSNNQRVLVELGLFQCAHVEEQQDMEGLLARVERLEEELNLLKQKGITTVEKVKAGEPAHKQEAEPLPAAEDEYVPPMAPPPETDGAFFFDESVMEEPPVRIEAAAKPKEETAMPAREREILAMVSPETVSAPQKEETQSAEPAAPSELNAEQIWNRVCSLASPRLRVDLQQGKGSLIVGNELHVNFPQDMGTAVESLNMERRKKEVAALIEQAAGRKLVFKADMTQYTDEQKRLMEESLKYIPKDITKIIT